MIRLYSSLVDYFAGVAGLFVGILVAARIGRRGLSSQGRSVNPVGQPVGRWGFKKLAIVFLFSFGFMLLPPLFRGEITRDYFALERVLTWAGPTLAVLAVVGLQELWQSVKP